MRISDWSSDVCSSDLPAVERIAGGAPATDAQSAHGASAILMSGNHDLPDMVVLDTCVLMSNALRWLLLRLGSHGCFCPVWSPIIADEWRRNAARIRSEEHTSELQSLMRISYAV